MKNWLVAAALAMLVTTVSGPALAGDSGQVPDATLEALGLSGVDRATDAEGMLVRGKAQMTIYINVPAVRLIAEQRVIQFGFPPRELVITVPVAVVEFREIPITVPAPGPMP